MNKGNLKLVTDFEHFSDVPERAPCDIFPGFSERLWELCAMAKIGLNPDGTRNASLLSRDLEKQKSTIHAWISEDKPPKDTSLDSLVRFLLSKVEDRNKKNVARVCAWLKYGGTGGVPNPFIEKKSLDYLPIAAMIVTKQADRLGLDAGSFNLDSSLDSITQVLQALELDSIDDVNDTHNELFSQILQKHKKED